VAIAAFAFSFGPAFPPYRWLYAVFPPMWGIRGAVRLGQIVLLAMAVLAGFGLARLQRQLAARVSTAACILLIAAVNLEATRAPFHYYEYRGIPPVYAALERLGPSAVVVWLPFPVPAFNHQNASFMLVSTRSWVRMLNGYSGFKPASYYAHAAALEAFPDRRSIDYLRAQRVTHVLVDGRNMRREALDWIATFDELTLITTDGNLRIYELRP
jgi:hypothetical protein